MQVSFAILVFAITLVFAVLQAGLFKRTVLSNSLLFILVGFLAGGVFGWTKMQPDHPIATTAIELALVSILFTDGMKIDLRLLPKVQHLPRQTLLLGMPMTFILITVAAHLIFGLPTLEALLVGAILTPTDPVMASDIIHRDEVPLRIRLPLSVESGLNDGLVLPVVTVLIEVIHRQAIDPVRLLVDVVGGVGIGIAIPWIVNRIAKSRFFSIEPIHLSIYVLSLGTLVIALADFIGVNPLLAAFSAGLTIGAINPEARDVFQDFGEIVSELLKLAALFIFGSLLSPQIFLGSSLLPYVFALFVLLIARPLTIWIVLFNVEITRMEKAAVAWFGPKGFSSILYLLFVWNAYIRDSSQMFTIVSITLVISIIAHSSTGLLFARWFKRNPIQDDIVAPAVAVDDKANTIKAQE